MFSLADLPPPASKEGNYFIYDRILGNLDIEFSHLVINFVESFCDIRAPDLRDALNYAQLYFAVAPLQQHMPSVLTQDQVSTLGEFFAYMVLYRNIDFIMGSVQTLKR